MNKSFPVLVAVLLLGGCAGQPVPVEASYSMINFADIAIEITVDYQPLDGPLDRLAKNQENDDSVARSL